MQEQQLQELRRAKWRLDGHPVHTLDDARHFIDSVGFCLLYPHRPPVLAPTFVGAYVGTDEKLPTSQTAFADPRAKQAKDLMVRLLRERAAYEANLFGENNFLVSASAFPYFYGLLGDRNPKAPPKATTRSGYSPLAVDAFLLIEKRGPISKQRLRDMLAKGVSEAALDRALDELWAKLRITRVDYNQDEGVFWDVLFRWSPDAVKEGMHVGVTESLTALVSKYLDCVMAAQQEEVESFFSPLIGRARVREAINALQAARELSFVHVGGRVLLQVASSPLQELAHTVPDDNASPAHTAAGKRASRTRITKNLGEQHPPKLQRGLPLVQRRLKPEPAAGPASPATRARTVQGPQHKLVIAIDGPAGSGKSSIAARVARALGYINLESGAMYRAVALKGLEQGLDVDDQHAMTELTRAARIELQPTPASNRVLLDGRDVSHRIRESDVTTAASRVSVHPAVRELLVARQRELGAGGGVIMEGRDIGTAVFPKADLKIFLDADPAIRAARRLVQNQSRAATGSSHPNAVATRHGALNAASGTSSSPTEPERIAAELAARDQRDRQRAASPLFPAADAITIDTTKMSIDEVVTAILALVDNKLQGTSTPSS